MRRGGAKDPPKRLGKRSLEGTVCSVAKRAGDLHALRHKASADYERKPTGKAFEKFHLHFQAVSALQEHVCDKILDRGVRLFWGLGGGKQHHMRHSHTETHIRLALEQLRQVECQCHGEL